MENKKIYYSLVLVLILGLVFYFSIFDVQIFTKEPNYGVEQSPPIEVEGGYGAPPIPWQ